MCAPNPGENIPSPATSPPPSPQTRVGAVEQGVVEQGRQYINLHGQYPVGQFCPGNCTLLIYGPITHGVIGGHNVVAEVAPQVVIGAA